MKNEPWVYIVLLGVFFIVISRFAAKPKPSINKDWFKEMEQTLDIFTEEMEKENEKIFQQLAKYKEEQSLQQTKLKNEVDALRVQVASVAQRNEVPQSPAEYASSPQSMLTAGQVDKRKEEKSLMRIKTRYKEIFALYEQNKSFDYIAKATGINKGEVQLIIQLGKQEERKL